MWDTDTTNTVSHRMPLSGNFNYFPCLKDEIFMSLLSECPFPWGSTMKIKSTDFTELLEVGLEKNHHEEAERVQPLSHLTGQGRSLTTGRSVRTRVCSRSAQRMEVQCFLPLQGQTGLFSLEPKEMSSLIRLFLSSSLNEINVFLWLLAASHRWHRLAHGTPRGHGPARCVRSEQRLLAPPHSTRKAERAPARRVRVTMATPLPQKPCHSRGFLYVPG